MTRKSIVATVAILLVGAGVVAANIWLKREKGLSVTTEVIRQRDLEADGVGLAVNASARVDHAVHAAIRRDRDGNHIGRERHRGAAGGARLSARPGRPLARPVASHQPFR